MAKVKFEKISFHYGSKYVLKDFSLKVESGQILCLMGPSIIRNASEYIYTNSFIPASIFTSGTSR